MTYNNTKARVLSPDGETELFDIVAGVLQGDTLAPYLFVIVLDYALRAAIDGKEEQLGFKLMKRQSRRIGPIVMTDLDFADDIALLSEEIDQAQELLQRVEQSVGKVGLKMNAAKTKVMSFNINHPTNLHTEDGILIDEVNNFKYLGSWMGSTEKDIKTRKAAAWRACNSLNSIWNSKLSRAFKLRVFSATVESVLTYGCEAWTVTPKIAKTLDGCYTRMLRKVLNVSWKQHITNIELYGELPKLTHKIRRRRKRFAGHCLRSKDEPISKLVLWTPRHGTRRRGRPPITYIDTLCMDTGFEPSELRLAMQDRTTWRTVVTRSNAPP